jgi:hypothetical protein
MGVQHIGLHIFNLKMHVTKLKDNDKTINCLIAEAVVDYVANRVYMSAKCPVDLNYLSYSVR